MTLDELRSEVSALIPRDMPVRGLVHVANAVVERIRARGLWSWAFANTQFTLTEEYATGTVDVDEGDATVTGSSTVWTSGMVGRKIRIAGGPEYTISSINTGAQTLELTQVFQGDDADDQTYTIYKNIYSLASDCLRVLRMWDVTDQKQFTCISALDARTRDNLLNTIGWSRMYALWGRDSSNYPQVYIYPYPTDAHVIEYLYEKTCTKVDSIGDSLDIPATLDDAAVTGTHAMVLQQNGQWDAWRETYADFKERIEMAWRDDQVLADQLLRMGRFDEMSDEKLRLEFSNRVTELP